MLTKRHRDHRTKRGSGSVHLRRFAIAALALGASLGVAACGGGGGGIESGGSSGSVQTVKLTGKPSGNLTISNWPLYIDKNTVPNFEKATGVSVKYIEDVNDNAEFFGKMQPLLAKGQSGGTVDLRRHRLDGEQDARARLPPEPRQVRRSRTSRRT